MPIIKKEREKQEKTCGSGVLEEESGKGPELKTENNLPGNYNEPGKK